MGNLRIRCLAIRAKALENALDCSIIISLKTFHRVNSNGVFNEISLLYDQISIQILLSKITFIFVGFSFRLIIQHYHVRNIIFNQMCGCLKQFKVNIYTEKFSSKPYCRFQKFGQEGLCSTLAVECHNVSYYDSESFSVKMLRVYEQIHGEFPFSRLKHGRIFLRSTLTRHDFYSNLETFTIVKSVMSTRNWNTYFLQ